MTLLQKEQSEGTSYLELAQFLRAAGDAKYVATDLEQLYRRVVFNVAIGNRDDHLRNHGFILGESGWRLAPAFDVNPNIDKADHVLNIDDADNRPSLRTVHATAAFYGIDASASMAIIESIAAVIDTWRNIAARCGISRADIEIASAAFSAHAAFRAGH
jgi:serine/threonine-protein kinase HipA